MRKVLVIFIAFAASKAFANFSADPSTSSALSEITAAQIALKENPGQESTDRFERAIAIARQRGVAFPIKFGSLPTNEKAKEIKVEDGGCGNFLEFLRPDGSYYQMPLSDDQLDDISSCVANAPEDWKVERLILAPN